MKEMFGTEPAVGDIGSQLSRWRREQPGTAAASAAGRDLLNAAELRLAPGAPDETDAATWHEFLYSIGVPDFLECLPDRASRERWTDMAFRAIERSSYSLLTMVQQRVAAHPERILFSDARDANQASTYAQVAWHTRTLAGLFLQSVPKEPRVAILCENSIDSACADLACLLYGILVSPLNVHLDTETLAWIFQRLAIDVVVTDSDERIARLSEVRSILGRDFKVFRTGDRIASATVRGLEVTPLRHAAARVDLAAISVQLAAQPTDLFAPATVMFTSGSTGRAKGVVFSQYNLITKRFARAAALPSVGRSEVLLCYLPLFHTFGRFFEMLGAIYWGGTYVFAGSPTAESFIAAVGQVRPTGLIGVPVRWTQIRQQCLDAMDRELDGGSERAAFRETVGERLRWGVSAAGFLDPHVFRFFQRHGVELCSGFGMTEATGGITMTPPGEYVDRSVGLPLPGMRLRFTPQHELQIAGPYVAHYLDEEAAAGSLPALDPNEDYWLATGDVFTVDSSGHLEIVDRIKDIYKNSRGQTIAPQRIEQRLASVPGIRRTFLVGDHRDHNVLLIVPNRDDPVLATRSDEELQQYLGQIVRSVNVGLAPYERVVRFAVLDRDFEVERDELTPKGSLRRKIITEHFAEVIETLYRRNQVELTVDGLRIRIPRWFYRDMALLEDDIVARKRELWVEKTGAVLQIRKAAHGAVRIGDLLYRLQDKTIDLGLFARQPRLWVGNPSLVAFSPCKPGWDVSLRGLVDTVRLPSPIRNATVPATNPEPLIADDQLRTVHAVCVSALFGTAGDATRAIQLLSELLVEANATSRSVIRRRLEALAYRPEEEVRACAYRVLVLDEPAGNYDRAFPPFVDSGLTFLDESSIAAIAAARHGERRLQALRQRLYSYRTQLDWPGPPARRTQFRRVFQLLADFARHDLESYPAVEAELAAWALFGEDGALARAAERQLNQLTAWRETSLARIAAASLPPAADKIVFPFGISDSERNRLRAVLLDHTFLLRSITHAFREDRFEWASVAKQGIWVSPMLSHHPLRLYRVGINLVDGKHFDLLLVLGGDLRKAKNVGDTVLWLKALSGHAFGPRTLPRVGAWRKDLGSIAIAYVNDLTAWDRIRELSRQQDIRNTSAKNWAWKQLFVRAMAVFFRAWQHSGYRIVPGAITPSNVSVPDADFHEATTILSLAGWRPYEGPLQFVKLLLRNFYGQTEALYPQSRGTLQVAWIFDACIEVLGPSGAATYLDELENALVDAEKTTETEVLRDALADYRAELAARPYVLMPVLCAIHRFHNWERVNQAATHEAREEAVIQMIHLYRLERFDEAFRYYVYQHTYFARAGAAVDEVFNRLVARRLGHPNARPGQLEELSELQDLMSDPNDREVFSRMVFPHATRCQQIELLQVGSTEDKRIIVRSIIRDAAGNSYEVRKPITPVELGQLYRLILETDYPARITANDWHLIIIDSEERIVGGLCYRWEQRKVVYLDGIVVCNPLMNRGLGGALIEDFCVRMAAEGARYVTTNFFLGQLFSEHGFRVNHRWGGLVRFLGEGNLTANSPLQYN
jgi:long-chain acyl-CoA synthetase